LLRPMKSAVPLSLSFCPARLDAIQSASGLILALFMWLHMLFVSSILLGKEAFWTVARFFEGYFILGRPFPLLVSLIVAAILALVVLHAVLALRKFPADWHQYRTFWRHAHRFPHSDTRLWLLQVITGFALFFLAPAHLYQMMAHPEMIGPYASADRVWSGHFWPLYLLLLVAVELHGGIGLYRLALKWGWFMGKDPARSRQRMKRGKWILTGLFIGVGLLALGAYIWIGIQHADRVGERYTPEWAKTETADETPLQPGPLLGSDARFAALADPGHPSSIQPAAEARP
jgi:fumarate reductase subunit C